MPKVNFRRGIFLFLYICSLAMPAFADVSLFGGRLVLPELSGYELYGSNALTSSKGTERWSIKEPSKSANKYLLVAPDRKTWVTVFEVKGTSRTKREVEVSVFDTYFKANLKRQRYEVKKSSTISNGTQKIGYYRIAAKQSKGHSAIVLYLPGKKSSVTQRGYLSCQKSFV